MHNELTEDKPHAKSVAVNSLLAALFIVLAITVSGRASPIGPDEYSTQRAPCPRDTKMECFGRDSQSSRCHCAMPGEMEQMLEDLTNLEIH